MGNNGRKPFYSDMPYGNVCPLCPSCVICPGPAHFLWEKGLNKKKQEAIIKTWKPFFDRALARQR